MNSNLVLLCIYWMGMDGMPCVILGNCQLLMDEAHLGPINKFQFPAMVLGDLLGQVELSHNCYKLHLP